MKTYIDCVPCFVRQSLELARRATDDLSDQKALMQKALRYISDLDYDNTPPEMAQVIHRYINETTGKEDLYADVKKWSNQKAMELLDELHEEINRSSCKFETAVRLAIAGNIIDFGVMGHVSDDMIHEAIKMAFEWQAEKENIEQLKDEAQKAKSILYILDNAGEIVFDRMLIEQLPTEKVTAVVRGKPVLNDVTYSDAELVGLNKLVRVIDNGTDAPGTVLKTCSDEFKTEFEKADLVIAKGQGNYETLNEIDKNIFFLLKAKCPVVANNTGSPLGAMLIFRKDQKSK